MMICDVLSAVLMTALTGLLATGHLALWLIYLVVGLTTVFDSFRSPAFAATVPLIVAREQLPRANAMGQAGGAAAGIIGPLLAGALRRESAGVCRLGCLKIESENSRWSSRRRPRPIRRMMFRVASMSLLDRRVA